MNIQEAIQYQNDNLAANGSLQEAVGGLQYGFQQGLGQITRDVCPHCGYCKHCGRSGSQYQGAYMGAQSGL